jgi:hypothetical protein
MNNAVRDSIEGMLERMERLEAFDMSQQTMMKSLLDGQTLAMYQNKQRFE